MLNGHGDDLYKSGNKIKANFSTNVWYDGDSDIIRSVLKTQIDTIFHYPEPSAESFVNEVAAFHGVTPQNVIAGNGATELFYLIAHAFEGAKTLLPIPSFREYEDACTLYRHNILFSRVELFEPEAADLMFICNPNNPNGYIWTREHIERILRCYPDMTLVVDESFINFAPTAEPSEPLLSRYPNLLIVHSMTKSFAIPGLRLGYMLGNEALIERIKAFKFPWSVNSLAIEVGKFLMKNGKYLLPDTFRLLKRKEAFVQHLDEINGFLPLNSGTSFFLVHTKYNVKELKQYLIDKHGILIREASNFRGLDEHYFRINTLSEEKNRMLVEALKNLEFKV
ncbi:MULTISPECIES: pyridoxal phosphate-dependent aminotransferase [Butyricimonas]|uniref:pyridoxal phosphate-dependent aminotransferase n=1 Tax=Butyricimonas TaxID=574697 RepID=UPI0007FB40EF|nr:MULTISPECIES: aminotransferase class I/II-fold pyridoxal phosphate-dependent enzyme [Butyricimonas]